MSDYIQNILNDALGDGARATKFDCDIIFTNRALASPIAINTVVKTAQFPGKTHEKINLMYKGRSIPVKGTTKYTQEWAGTFYLSEDHKIKNAFEVWLEALDQKHNYSTDILNLSTTQAIHAASGYSSTIVLYQKNFDGDQSTAVYTLYNAFPTEIGNIEYNGESVGEVQEFSVNFSYSHYILEVNKTIAGNFVDQQIEKVRTEVQNLASQAVQSTGNFISGLIPSGVKTSLTEQQQITMPPSAMTHTIQDVFG